MDHTVILPGCSNILDCLCSKFVNLHYSRDILCCLARFLNNHCPPRATSDSTMEPEENDPAVLLLTCPHCKTRCNSTTALFNHMEFPGNPCLAHLGMDFAEFKRRWKSKQQMARRDSEDYNRRRREEVSPCFVVQIQSSQSTILLQSSCNPGYRNRKPMVVDQEVQHVNDNKSPTNSHL